MKIQASKNYVSRDFAGESVLIPVGSENSNALIMLNRTGSFIWENIQQPIEVDELIARASTVFEDTNGELEEQLKAFILELMEKQFAMNIESEE